MSRITAAQSTSAPKSPLSSIFQAFATLLTVSTPSNPTAQNVLAATGTISVDTVTTIVTTCSQLAVPVKLDKETITARAQDHKALRDVAAFLEHLRLARRKPDRRQFIAAASYFKDFIHHRAFEKIHARMTFGYKFWEGGDPLKLLDGRPAGEIEPTEFSMHDPPELMLEILERRALAPSVKDLYTVTTVNAAEWLGDTVETVKGQGRRKFLKATRLFEFTKTMHSLNYILECKPLVTALQSAYRWCNGFLIRPLLPVAGRNEEDQVYYLDDEDAAVFHRNSIVQGGIVHVFRYYRLFTAWTRAAQVVIEQIYKMPDHRLEFHLVTANALDFEPVYPKLTSEDVLAFMRLFPDVRERSPFKEITDTGDGFEHIRGSVHCEAQLMGLVDLRTRGGNHLKAETLAVFPDVQSQFPIGVGRKCCYLCAALASELEKTGRTEFILPGTHGTVYPWVPPPPPYLDFETVQRVGQLLDYTFRLHFPPKAKESSLHNTLPAPVERRPLFKYEDEMRARQLLEAADE
ncbi:hypothetical protein CYLTODRAFT_492714 [Cylindrobasidium torrendii FP15055 ss-10]|uniref:Uncharacterized protein n=1 Tax=Cylindrobasidium torrendii FP15055 ss-10 TaxID=1314674 RepID=A0A0D7B411_9AGAR|nr:hypothetical protein CYLTODRAFT_492714 [Cylindrobasidium torrendii FP15055 ss-10]